ncbi:MAG: hypothetical protein C0601_05180 [Candidatus Muiribacterium halophilum]|uniref:Uncharacterized protein n=1 Tax=Muiribacterium halophilum TaxID=2053465 RepID=A0A2N5ZIH1_MUIH1|nr:MAG: hypothetical protein C0601_05180 [Candidatus Muirbacterium halophilum]
MLPTILICLKNYFKKTFFYSELLVVAAFFYIFIVKASVYTFAHDTFIIQLNAAIAFSGLLTAYRIFVYELPETMTFINSSGRTKYYFSRLITVCLINIIILAIFYISLYIYKGDSINDFSKYIMSLPPVLINNFIYCALGVLFSPVVLSIHQVIHGIFFVSVGINLTAIASFFDNVILKTIFSIIMYIFPPIEHLIALSVNPVFSGKDAMITMIWGVLYTFIVIFAGYYIFKNKDIHTNDKGII